MAVGVRREGIEDDIGGTERLERVEVAADLVQRPFAGGTRSSPSGRSVTRSRIRGASAGIGRSSSAAIARRRSRRSASASSVKEIGCHASP
jgi:hypothetical protein